MARFIPIKPKYIPKGVKLCIDNVTRLLEDAELLYKNEKYPSSIVYSILAFEEIAKARMLRSKWSKGKNVQSEDWKILTHHLSKSKYGFRFLHEGTLRFNSLKNFKELQAKMIQRSAKENTQDKENFSFVNWTGLGWTSPMFPEPLQIHFDKTERLKAWSKERLHESKQSLEKFMRESLTKKILAVETSNPIDPYEINNFIKNLGSNNSLSVKQVSITLGEISGLIINSESVLTDTDQRTIEKTILKKFPFLHKLEFEIKPPKLNREKI